MAAQEQWQTLGETLAELEENDPYLRKLIEDQEYLRWRHSFRDRINQRRKAEGKPSLWK